MNLPDPYLRIKRSRDPPHRQQLCRVSVHARPDIPVAQRPKGPEVLHVPASARSFQHLSHL